MNPLIVENRFQKLCIELQLTCSPRLRLLETMEFLEEIGRPGNGRFACDYASELLEPFLSLILRTDFSDTPLTILDRFVRCLQTTDRSLHADAWRGQIEAAVGYLEKERDRIRSSTPQRDGGLASGRREAVVQNWRGGWVPLVEREPLRPGLEPRFAGIYPLLVNVEIRSGVAVEDAVEFLQLGERGSNEIDRLAGQAARNLFRIWTGRELPGRLVVGYSFGRFVLVLGRSHSAALAIAIFLETLRLTGHRHSFHLAPNVAVTGVISSSGRIESVDESGLRSKLEAMAFSPLRYFVVPKAQYDVAQDLWAEIASRSPESQRPVIVGAEDLADILQDGRLTSSKKTSVVAHASKRAWERRHVLTTIGLAVALFLVLWADINPFHRAPSRRVYDGSVLQIGDESESLSMWVQFNPAERTNRMPLVNRVQLSDSPGEDTIRAQLTRGRPLPASYSVSERPEAQESLWTIKTE